MSGRKSNLSPVEIAVAGSLGANYTSPVTVLNFQDNICYQCNITGATAAGTLVPQVSQDYKEVGPAHPVANVGTWVDMPGITATIAGPDQIIFDLNQLAPCAIRLSFTRTGGTGSMDIYVSGKQV